MEEKLTKKVYITKVKPRINSDGNLRILDLIAWEKDQSMVCDVTTVSDTAPLDEVHTSKTQNYDNNYDFHIWMTNNSPGEFPPPKVYVTAFVCNWRGMISSKSYSSWRGLGFSRSMLMNLSTQLSPALTACGNTTSEKRKSDGGKELDCSDDIYRVIH